jgi:RNA-directed DNA polymerase
MVMGCRGIADPWLSVEWCRRHRRARGDVIIVRFADDFICGFQHKQDARRFLADLHQRLGKFGRTRTGRKAGPGAAECDPGMRCGYRN